MLQGSRDNGAHKRPATQLTGSSRTPSGSGIQGDGGAVPSARWSAHASGRNRLRAA